MAENVQSGNVKLRRRLRYWRTRVREIRKLTWRGISTRSPILAHIIPIRRCNLGVHVLQ